MREIIVALDCDKDRAYHIVRTLKGRVRLFKIGPVLFVKEGINIINWINSNDALVFLDIKLHDIPNTVKNTVKNLRNLGIYSLSVHICGGFEMLKAANEEAENRIKIWGVTVLTSIDKLEYAKIGFRYSLEHQVLHFARIAEKAKLDGIVVSPRELFYVTKFVKNLKFVTPSIRIDESFDDQKRFMTPSQAIRYGANYLVIGRPIVFSEDPIKVVDSILEDIKNEHRKNT